jgi:hypothetical protein
MTANGSFLVEVFTNVRHGMGGSMPAAGSRMNSLFIAHNLSEAIPAILPPRGCFL